MNLQWYPGHMTKAKRMMQENIKLIDLVIELVDARAPMSSRNPDIDELAKGKSRMIILNKIDLADDKRTNEWASLLRKGSSMCWGVRMTSSDGNCCLGCSNFEDFRICLVEVVAFFFWFLII